MKSLLPVLTVVGAILLVWVVAVVPMNMHLTADQAQRDGLVVTPEEPRDRQAYSGISLTLKNPHLMARAYVLDRPRLPSPHQVVVEMWKTIALQNVTSRRSLAYHGWVTLSATLQGLLPKAIISAYLSFFPVVVGMVKGLRSPDGMQLDLLRTYHASPAQGFWKLRLPGSVPYLFASLKIGISASLVGAIVAELPTGARAGFGARMLVGDQYGQPMVTWAALFAAAITAAALVGFFGFLERWTLRRMGMQAA